MAASSRRSRQIAPLIIRPAPTQPTRIGFLSCARFRNFLAIILVWTLERPEVWWGRTFRPRPHAFPPFEQIRRNTSPTNEAAVDNQIDACTEGRRLARQKDGGPDQLIDGGHAAKRSVGLEFFDLLRHLRTQIHRCGRITGADRIHPDTSITPFHG